MKISLRNIRKHKGYVFLNVTGLALGMACSVLTLVYVRYEMNYEKLENSNRIYRVVRNSTSGQLSIPTQPALAPALREECPGVETATALVNFAPLLSCDQTSFLEANSAAADFQFFAVFPFPLVKGDPNEALSEPNSIVLSQTAAEKYFGSQDPMNKTVWMKRHGQEAECRVTAVMKDMSANTHFHFDILISMKTMGWSQDNWGGAWVKTYVLLKNNISPQQMNIPLSGLLKKYVYPDKVDFPIRYFHCIVLFNDHHFSTIKIYPT